MGPDVKRMHPLLCGLERTYIPFVASPGSRRVWQISHFGGTPLLNIFIHLSDRFPRDTGNKVEVGKPLGTGLLCGDSYFIDY